MSLRLPSFPRRTVLGAILLAVGTASLTGCATEEIPPEEKEAINLGANASVGVVEVENLLVVTQGGEQPARLIGVLLNRSESSVEVEISDDDDEVTIALEPGQQYAFHENPTLFETADEIPGALSDVSVTVGDETEAMRIPIRDGSLNWLKPYVPR